MISGFFFKLYLLKSYLCKNFTVERPPSDYSAVYTT